MAKNFFKRYIWLVDLINRKSYVSFREISEAWSRSPLNETGAPLSERTFFNHKEAIADIFGIEILNDRSLGFHIGHSDVGSDETANWMLHTLCLNNVLKENADMKDRILMERIPSSERFLTDIISAMRDSKVISLAARVSGTRSHTASVSGHTVSNTSSKDGICSGTATWDYGYIHWTGSWIWGSWRRGLNSRRISTRRDISVISSVSSSGSLPRTSTSRSPQAR